MHDITQPLRLAVGSHEAGSGKGCAMNVISWENGDTVITDTPSCADLFLARVVQRVNDKVCTHRDGDLLCQPCSVKVLELGHRTVGTNLAAHGWGEDRVRRVWVELALEQAESVARDGEDPRVTECRRVTRAWLDGDATTEQVRAAADRAYAAYAAYDAAYAAYAASAAYAVAPSDADAYAAAAAASASVGEDRLVRAHHVIDRFEQITGLTASPTPDDVTARAYAAMTA